MRAIQLTETGGPDVLKLAELPDPEPGPGQLLIEVAAVGPGGTEGGFTVGDRVAWAMSHRSYAEQAVVPAAQAVLVPPGLDIETAAGTLLQGMTAHYLAVSVHPVLPGETVLVDAAAGGMGLLLTQLATARGGRVIGTVSTPEKERLAREAGAAEVIRYTEVDDLAGEAGHVEPTEVPAAEVPQD
ncbi:MAG: zinc-binding dehydrogenase, partial [Pseudonocardiaceae bacterium]